MRLLAAILLLGVGAAQVLANDGFSQIGIGGLVLTDTDKVSMDKEELYVSAQKISVDYIFSNATDKDVEATVMFPLPDINIGEEFESARGLVSFERDLKFKTVVDGKPFPIALEQRAFAKGRDITEALLKAGIPVSGVMDNFEAHVRGLVPDVQKNLIGLGALPKFTDDAGKELPYPADFFPTPEWTIKSYMKRTQIFPAGRPLNVSHSYVPVTGQAVEGSLNYTAEYLKEIDAEGVETLKKEQARYCVDDDWIKTYRARVKKEKGRLGSPTWITYILSSGATWKGPIKDFRLVVDKGKADALVSFCGDGVKKISPTQFEMRKKNFEPKEDLNVLIVEWARE